MDPFKAGAIIELAHVLQFIHNHGFVHCDVKPANVLFRRDDSLVLTDFGIAKKNLISPHFTCLRPA